MNTTITAAHAVTIAVLDEHAAALRRSLERERQGYLTPTGVREHMEHKAQELEWASRLDAAAASIQREIDAADAAHSAAYLHALGAPSGTPQEQMLAEQRAYRAWQRLRTILDTLDAASMYQRIPQALSASTGDERRIIAEELPAYAEARDLPIDVAGLIHTALLDDAAYASANERRTATHTAATSAVTALRTVRDHVSGTNAETAHIDLLVRSLTAG